MSNFWDTRYSQVDSLYGKEANDFLKSQAIHFKTPSSILTVGEGEGRNALFLARLGHKVHCIDSSKVAKEKAQILFNENKLDVKYDVEDLMTFSPEEKYDVIVSIWCHLPKKLRKEIHAKMYTWLKPGGFLLIEGYTPKQLEYSSGGPKDIDMLYDKEEIEEELSPFLKIIFYESTRLVHEGIGHDGMSATLQILCRKD